MSTVHGISPSSPWVVDAIPRPDVERVLQCVAAGWNIYLNKHAIKLLRKGANPKMLREDKLTKSICAVLQDRKLTQRFGLLPHFRTEPHICKFNNSGEVKTIGRTDIEYLQNFCLVIEFKKLNGKTGLREKYRKDGIFRFTSNKYAENDDVGAMCGILTTRCGTDVPALQTDIPSDASLEHPLP